MEERALYQAILAAPHDDAARLVYADWLDENAVSPAEHARAELIRVQCKIARLGPGGWGRVTPVGADPPFAKRQKRLLFQHGRKWRRWFPIALASSPFDRGFLRPFVSMRPQEFLEQLPTPERPIRSPLPPLPADSPARRYAPEMGSTFRACPLWDVHLYATPFAGDPLADRGQYANLLAEVGRSPLLERVGWLKVTFFGTPVTDFLRTGNFANVETLVLNAGPFPEVLEAVSENESFRSLRYIEFGHDYDAWLTTNYPTQLRFARLAGKLGQANERHLPFGEMRTALRAILRNTPLPPAAPPPAPPQRAPEQAPAGATEPDDPSGLRTVAFVVAVLVLWAVGLVLTRSDSVIPPTPQLNYDPDQYKILPAVYDLIRKAKTEPPQPAAKPDPRPEKEQRKDFVGPPAPKE